MCGNADRTVGKCAKIMSTHGRVAQLGERYLRKVEVRGSIPLTSTRFHLRPRGERGLAFAGRFKSAIMWCNRDMATSTKKKILVIDDDAEMRRLLNRIFCDDYEVLLAPDSEKGLELLKSDTPHLILLDLVMPGMNGIDFLDALAGEKYRPPVVMLTSVEDVEIATSAIAKGAVEYVSKLELARLKKLVDAKLSRSDDAACPWKVSEQ